MAALLLHCCKLLRNTCVAAINLLLCDSCMPDVSMSSVSL